MLKIALKWFYGFLISCFQESSLPVRHYKKKSKEYCKLQASSAVAFKLHFSFLKYFITHQKIFFDDQSTME